MKRIVIWCVGNPLLSDDGAGPALYSLLKGTLPAQIELVNCETTPENWISPLRKNPPSLLIIADGADMNLPYGALRRMTLPDRENLSFGTHGIPLSLLLAPLSGSFDILATAVQPKIRGIGTDLSPEVEDAVSRLALLLREERWMDLEPYQENLSPR